MAGIFQTLLGSLAGVAKDTFFKYVTLLLPGNGTNGAQNNTFIDGSTNNFTITRNGNTTQGTFTPFGDNWSNYFDGNGDYLSVADNAALEIGASSFCIEGWIYLSSLPSSGNRYAVLGKWVINQYSYIFNVYNNSGTMQLELFWSTDGSSASSIVQNASITANTWHHIAVTRDSTTGRFFLDGTQQGGTQTVSGTFYNGTAAVNVGRHGDNINYLPGYISNCRLVIGSAVYTASFTPPTAPLTAITNTQLLTCQSNRFIDNSTNNYTITPNGDVSVQRFSPFSPTNAYSTSVIGGSGYFDGSGDYLSTSGTSSFNPSTGSWTFEAWCYFTSSSNTDYLITGLTSGTASFYIAWVGTTFYVGDGVTNNINGIAASKPVNQWFHVAVVKNGSTYTAYINGSSIASSTTALASSGVTTFEIGARSPASLFSIGYISNFRYSQSAVYTAAFTPPASPVTGGALLLNFTNAGIIDNAMLNNLETVGNAQISTAQSKFGGSSILINGTGNWLTVPSTENYKFGTGDFTIEAWIYSTSFGAYQTILDSRAANSTSPYGWFIEVSTGKPYWYDGSGFQLSSTGMTLNTWQHLAISRSGSTIKMFLNGTEVFSGTNTNSQNPTGVFRIGRNFDNDAPLVGYIDDFRITKGVARYTANFTPPAAAFPTS